MPGILILLVDDDLVDRMACRRALRGDPARRFALVEAEDGEAGLQLARSMRPDCILLDYKLPDLSGLEFLARLAGDADESVRAIPVLMLTGADSAAVATEAMRRGAGDYLVKDGESRYLELVPAAVERLMRERRLVAEKRQAEAKFRTLVEQTQAISYIVEREQPERLQYISPQVCVLGYSAQEWLDDPDLHARLLLPGEGDSVMELIRHSRAHGLPLRVEYQMRKRDGGSLWFRDHADVVHDDTGRALFMQGTMVDITASKLAERCLLQSQDALRKLAAHQERIRENERQRIAREVHDELGGLLTGIKAYLSVLAERCRQAGQAPEPLLADAAALTQDAIDTVRRVITDLRPSVLDQLGIWAALEWHLAQIGQRSGLRCGWHITPAAAAIALDPDRSTMLFRIVQEGLINVQRHARASEVELRVAYSDGKILLTVEDDGCGIGPGTSTTTSWGILGMQERSRSFGGEVVVRPRAGGGTILMVRFPVEDAHVS